MNTFKSISRKFQLLYSTVHNFIPSLAKARPRICEYIQYLYLQINGQVRGGGSGDIPNDQRFIFLFLFSFVSCYSPVMESFVPCIELYLPSMGIAFLYMMRSYLIHMDNPKVVFSKRRAPDLLNKKLQRHSVFLLNYLF